MKRGGILNESQKRKMIEDKQKLIIESFANIFNRIKRVDDEMINESLITEGTASPFKLQKGKYFNPNYMENFIYISEINGIPYEIEFSKNLAGGLLGYGQWQLSFNTKYGGTKDRVGTKIRTHFNDVLATIGDIIEDVVKRFKVRQIMFSGSADKDKDKGKSSGETLRMEYYTRFLKNRFSSQSISGPNLEGQLTLDLTNEYPEIFDDKTFYPDRIKYNLTDIFEREDDNFVFDDFNISGIGEYSYDYEYLGMTSNDDYLKLQVNRRGEEFNITLTIGDKDYIEIMGEKSPDLNNLQVIHMVENAWNKYLKEIENKSNLKDDEVNGSITEPLFKYIFDSVKELFDNIQYDTINITDRGEYSKLSFTATFEHAYGHEVGLYITISMFNDDNSGHISIKPTEQEESNLLFYVEGEYDYIKNKSELIQKIRSYLYIERGFFSELKKSGLMNTILNGQKEIDDQIMQFRFEFAKEHNIEIPAYF